MTKVEVEYKLTAPVTADLMDAIDRAHAIYGLLMVRLSPGMDSVLVHYDASRLKLADVDHSLLGIGLPVSRAV